MKDAPKKVKYSRCFRIKLKNKMKPRSRHLITYNYKYGIKALENGWLTMEQLKPLLRLMRIVLNKKIKIKVNSSLIIPISRKPLETRMGSGKGERKHWWSHVHKGMIIFEFSRIDIEDFYYISRIIMNRLTIRLRSVRKIY